jgi:hypothetical protein
LLVVFYSIGFQADPPIGGSSDSLKVTAAGAETEMPSFVLPSQEQMAGEIRAAITALVPESIWAKLEQEREQYIEEHVND